MGKIFLRLMAWLGLVLTVVGLLVSTVMLVIGLFLIVLAVVTATMPDAALRRDQVIDTWGALIEKANGKDKEVTDRLDALLKESKAPSLSIMKKSIAPSWMKGMRGKTRDFIVVTDKRSPKLEPYQIFINARDYGDNLDVAWYLTYRPTMWQVIGSLFWPSGSVPKSLGDLDIFDQQDLTAYATNAHKCMEKAVEKIMMDAGQDPSKVDWKSKGFLGIS